MDAPARLAVDEPEPLVWAEIVRRYPDQYVCLVDIERVELGSPEIVAARVVGQGATHGRAFEPIRDLPERYPRFAIRHTGASTAPILRPWLVLDDEDLEILRS